MKPVDHAARKAAATDLDTTFFVEAAAGTGKTTLLVARILSVLKERRARLPEIVAITFTEKAAGELKLRLRAEIGQKLAGHEALADLERTHITTIHSFCAGILRDRPVEAQIDPQFVVADELQRELLREQAWRTWLEKELVKNPPALRSALMRDVSLEQLEELADLLVAQRTRLTNAQIPALVPLDADGMLDELRDAVPALERALIHCTTKTENYYQQTQALLETLPQLTHTSVERRVAVLSKIELKQSKRIADFDDKSHFDEFKRIVKALQMRLEGFTSAAGHNFLVELTAWLHGFVAHFQDAKRSKAMLDFDDLLVTTRDLLRDHPEVRQKLQERFKFLLVDEFQDTDPVQAELVLLLAGETPGKLFVVGDPKQSIYSFRGADIEMYAGVRRQIETRGRVLQLQQNFRSQSTLLDWVNEVFSKVIIQSDDGDYQPDYIPLKPSPHLETSERTVVLLRPQEFPKLNVDELRRAEFAVTARYLMAQGFKWSDVVILVRSFTGVDILSEVLQEHGVPHRVIGGKGYYQRQEIQTLCSLLSCLDNPRDTLHLVATLRSPLFGWPDEFVFLTSESRGLDYLTEPDPKAPEQVRHTYECLRTLHECRHDGSVARFVERAMAATKICEAFIVSQLDGAQCVANLLKALELARRLEAAGLGSLRGFVRQLRATVLGGYDEEPSPASEETENVVRILTMHKAKGLQFPVVVLADLAGRSHEAGTKLVGRHDWQLRFAQSRTRGFDEAVARQDKREEAEEIRLLYVAATRAQKQLIIPWFAEKGERLDLLRRGFEPVESKLVKMDLNERPPSRSSAENARPDPDFAAKRCAWQQARAALRERAAQPVARRSPSQLAGEHEPFHEQEPGETTARERAIEIGVAVHAELAGLPVTATLSAEEQQRVHAMVTRAQQSDLMKRVNRADDIYRELPFALPGMEGKIDLLFREGKRWVLVDYKTDATPAPEKYRPQMQAYAEALEMTAGVKVAETLLFFLATGTVAKMS